MPKRSLDEIMLMMQKAVDYSETVDKEAIPQPLDPIQIWACKELLEANKRLKEQGQ